MNPNENNKQNFIIIGGCHVDGYGAEGNPSFVDIIESELNLNCVLKKATFQLKNIGTLASIIEQNPTNLIFLQVGNYEFSGSLKTLFPPFNSTKSGVSKIENENQVSYLTETINFNIGPNKFYSSTLFLLKLILTPVIWSFAKYKNKKSLLLCHEIIKKNLDKTFVIISPLPCYKTPTVAIRRKASLYYQSLFNLPNVIFVDSFQQFPLVKSNFFNRYHLNSKGHEQLGKIIADKISSEI